MREMMAGMPFQLITSPPCRCRCRCKVRSRAPMMPLEMQPSHLLVLLLLFKLLQVLNRILMTIWLKRRKRLYVKLQNIKTSLNKKLTKEWWQKLVRRTNVSLRDSQLSMLGTRSVMAKSNYANRTMKVASKCSRLSAKRSARLVTLGREFSTTVTPLSRVLSLAEPTKVEWSMQCLTVRVISQQAKQSQTTSEPMPVDYEQFTKDEDVQRGD